MRLMMLPIMTRVLKSEITIAGVQLTVGGTTTLNEAHYAGNTSYEFPLIGGVQVDHYWGAWCTFCHKVDAHPGKVELDACTGGHMHGGGSH
jgi:starvation-inducible outer membrane lipoprotein